MFEKSAPLFSSSGFHSSQELTLFVLRCGPGSGNASRQGAGVFSPTKFMIADIV
jgi:hypothetical protein